MINNSYNYKSFGVFFQYTVAGHEGPTILLVHGFGAFLDHYRDNILSIADDGHRVWAITLIGFGKSEKPNIVYTELMWAELLRDFIVDVVGEPVHLVGNSIGGTFYSTIISFQLKFILSNIFLILQFQPLQSHTCSRLSFCYCCQSLVFFNKIIGPY